MTDISSVIFFVKNSSIACQQFQSEILVPVLCLKFSIFFERLTLKKNVYD
jgi:hypothetical protein